MENKSWILVTGATGQQGGAAARELLSDGHRVRVMTRKPESEKAQQLASRGAEVVQGDFDDLPSLERALDSAWGVFSVQNTWEAGVEREEEQGKRFAELARRKGVQSFVYSSVGSAHRHTGIPHFDNKWRIEEVVRGAGFPSYTILRPAFFMENFVSPWFFPALLEGALRMGIRPDTRLQMIAVSDIGKYIHLAFDRPEEMARVELDIAGDARTMPEAAAILAKNMGRPVQFVRTPIEQVRQWSTDFATMLEWFDRVGYNAEIPALEKRFGIRPTSLEQWAQSTRWAELAA